MDFLANIQQYIKKEQEILAQLDGQAINQVMGRLLQALEEERDIYIFGNGGSAATATHFEADFNKGVSQYTEKKFRFHCLNDNVAVLTAIANDFGYDQVFLQQLKGRLKPGDLVVAISGSGNSENVVKAVEFAKSQGNHVVGLTGYGGGRLREMADFSLHVPVEDMQITEDIHMLLDHLMMSVFVSQFEKKG